MKKKSVNVEDKMVRGPKESEPAGGFPPHCCFDREPVGETEDTKQKEEVTEDDGA